MGVDTVSAVACLVRCLRDRTLPKALLPILAAAAVSQSMAAPVDPSARRLTVGYFGDSTSNTAIYTGDPSHRCGANGSGFVCGTPSVDERIAADLKALAIDAEVHRHAYNRSQAAGVLAGSGYVPAGHDLASVVARQRPDVVVFNFGINDALIGAIAPAMFGRTVSALRATAEAGGARVVLFEPPVMPESWPGTAGNCGRYFGSRAAYDDFVSRLTAYAAVLDDMRPERTGATVRGDAALPLARRSMSDCLHPDQAHYDARASEVAARIGEAIGAARPAPRSGARGR